MSTRGSFSGSGLRPVGLARWCCAMVCVAGGVAGDAGAADEFAAPPVISPSSDIVTWLGSPRSRSRPRPMMPNSSLRHCASISR